MAEGEKSRRVYLARPLAGRIYRYEICSEGLFLASYVLKLSKGYRCRISILGYSSYVLLQLLFGAFV